MRLHEFLFFIKLILSFILVWTYRFLFYSVLNLLLSFVLMLALSQVRPLGAFSSFCVLLTCPHQSLSTSMFSATRCLRVILYFPAPDLESTFSPRRVTQKPRSGAKHVHYYLGFGPPKSNKSRQYIIKNTFYMYVYFYMYIYTVFRVL